MNLSRALNAGLWTSGVLFGLMAAVQLLRLVIRPEVEVSGHSVPLWPSVLALLILGGMCAWMLWLARGWSRTHVTVG